jgi:PAS domain S-box-containing protein
MHDFEKTKQQLIAELDAARQRIAQLEPQEKARQLAEQSLAESTDRYRLFVENAGDAIYLADQAGTLLDVNPEACRQTGYSREELLGMLVQDLDVHETPEMDAYITPGKTIGTTSFESEHRRKDGSIFPVEVRAAAIDTSGKTLLLGFVRDISDRKQAEASLRESEERLRIISENIYDWEYWRAPDGKYLWMSPS